MTLPLLGMVDELKRREAELVLLLNKKDREIDEYKAQGAKITRSKCVLIDKQGAKISRSNRTVLGMNKAQKSRALRTIVPRAAS